MLRDLERLPCKEKLREAGSKEPGEEKASSDLNSSPLLPRKWLSRRRS